MIKRTALLGFTLLLLLGLGGCGSVPPAPVDRFYRLQATELPAAKAMLEVRNIGADSLYAERPIVFTDAGDSRQLRQYHYHLWLYPPAQLLREHMRSSFGTGTGKLQLDTRIVSFDRVLDGKASSAQVVLDITLSSAGKPLLEKRYQTTQAATDDSFSAFSAAMEQALARLYGEILRDAGELKAERK